MGKIASVIIVNYNGPFDMLSKCLRASESQNYPDVETILVDNGSSTEDLLPVKKAFPRVKFLEFGRNLGFAEANNRAIKEATGDYVMLLNNDAYMEPDALKHLVEQLESADDIVGVAPKMMLAGNPNVFDSIGSLIDYYVCAFNMGIGQVDIGQYDRPERVFGCCFGAALIRKEAFSDSSVGPLDSSYFMYYEDIDWCVRANLFGLRFVTAPQAIVYHEHSYSTRKFAYNRKYYLIERNLMRTVMKNFRATKSAKVFIRRELAHTRNIITGPFRGQSLKLVFNFPIDFVRFFLFGRRRIQKKRIISDDVMFQLSNGERPFFNPEEYAPVYSLAAIQAIYRRLLNTTGDQKYLEIVDTVRELRRTKLASDIPLAQEVLRSLLADEPELIKDYIDKIQPQNEENVYD